MNKTGREQFTRYRKMINFIVTIFNIMPKSFLIFIWDWSSKYSQLPFIALRYIILKTLCEKCGDNIRIGKNVTIISWKKLVLGDNISIHDNCYIDAEGGVNISNNVSIAHNSSILSSNHDWKNEHIPIKYNPVIPASVTIYEDVWIGCGCRVLAGVNIQSRSVVAAGSVVNRNVNSRTIVGGIPAKVLKEI